MLHCLSLLLTVGAAWADEPGDAPPSDDTPAVSSTASPDPAEEPAPTRQEVRDQKVRDRAGRIFDRRSLGNHPFITPQFAESALVTSYLGSGFGAAAVFYETLDSDGNQAQGTYVAAAGGLEAGVGFGKWVGLDAHASGLAGVSAVTSGGVQLGAAALWNVGGGLPIRVVQARSTAFTIKPVGDYTDATGVDINAALQEVVRQSEAGENLDLVEASRYLLVRTRSYGGGLQLAFAQSAGSLFGLQLSAGASYQRIVQTYYDGQPQTATGNGLDVSGGLALSLDFNPVPLAIMAEYGIDVGLGLGDLAGTTDLTHDVGLGLYLNGMTNTVGLQAFVALAQDEIDAGAMLAFRAYF
ncbi:MAG: hypothetical protein H6733_03910 [Alphaproteobacteria bacterium]|nr:hypothetical protein [Alphaproteobacteria bacterium]